MKTSLSTIGSASAGLLLSALLAGNAFAGPGPQYWQSVGKPAAPAAEQAKAADLPVCPGSDLVAVTAMKSLQSNGRPPLTAVQVGTQRVCHVCPTTKVETTGDWPSHRGPMVQKIEVSNPGATHVCTAACTPSGKA